MDLKIAGFLDEQNDSELLLCLDFKVIMKNKRIANIFTAFKKKRNL